jgi:hypothetical protein
MDAAAVTAALARSRAAPLKAKVTGEEEKHRRVGVRTCTGELRAPLHPPRVGKL